MLRAGRRARDEADAESASPAATFAGTSDGDIASSVNVTAGNSSVNSSTVVGSTSTNSESIATIVTWPERSPFCASSSERSNSKSCSVVRTWRSTTSPAAFRRMPEGSRSNSSAPSSSSSCRICRLTALEATNSFCAALRIEPARATSRK